MPSAAAFLSHHANTIADQGFLVLRGLIDEASLQPVRDALDARVQVVLEDLHAEGRISDTRRDLPFARRLAIAGHHANRFGRSWTTAMAVPAVYNLHRAPAVQAVLEELLGAEVMGHRQFNIRPKLPGQETTTVPWHQDSAYYGPHTVDDTIFTVWAPLVEVDQANGCMQVVPGSHRGGLRAHDTEQTEAAFLCLRGEPDPATVLTVPMVPGDVLIMHNLLWHRSLPNTTDGIRWSIDMRFYAPTTPHAKDLLAGFPEPWATNGSSPTAVERWQSWYK